MMPLKAPRSRHSQTSLISEDSAKHDHRYKKYALAVEKNLQLFEAISEWADIISFLTKFCKTLQAFPHYRNVPKKVLVSKRLAQCLNPALPSGVHQKAIETYALIFEKLGSEKLQVDFYIYSYGILPFFRHCSLSVRNSYLGLFKKYLLPLCITLPSCLKSLILALFPGLEEEGSEHFDQVLELMRSIKTYATEESFYRCLWNCLLYSPMQRLSITTFLAKTPPSLHYFENASEEDKLLMVMSVGAALNDTVILVVRGSLEFIIKYLKINTKFVSQENILRICRSVLQVFLKRDISLSRRCITWIHGNSLESTTSNPLNVDIINFITIALKRMLMTKSEDLAEISIPYKILVALLDKPEMGNPICVKILMDVIISIYIHFNQNERRKEILEAANMFFEVVDLHVVWSAMYKAFNQASELNSLQDEASQGKDNPSSTQLEARDLLPVFLFAIKYLKICDNEAEHLHLPFFLYKTLYYIKNYCIDDIYQDMTEPGYAIRICLLIIEKIPQTYLKVSSKESGPHETLSSEELNIVLDKFYDRLSNTGSIKIPSPKSLFQNLVAIAFGIAKDSFALIIASQVGLNIKEEHRKKFIKLSMNFATFIDWACVSYATIFQPKLEDTKMFIDAINIALSSFIEIDSINSMSAIVRLSIKLCKFSYYKPTLAPIFSRRIPRIYEELWQYFDLDQDIQRLRIVQLFWSIHLSFTNEEMDRFFSLLLAESDDEARISSFIKFSKFWEISNSIPFMSSTALKKCLFIMIDALNDSNISIRRICTHWLANSISNCSRLLDPLLLILSDANISIGSKEMRIFKDQYELPVYLQSFNCAQVLYSLNCLLALSKNGSSGIIEIVKKQAVISDIFLGKYQSNNTLQFVSYAELLFDAVAKFIFAEIANDIKETEIVMIIHSIQMSALEFISLLIKDVSFISMEKLDSFASSIIQKLLFTVHHHRLDMQPKLLQTLLHLCRRSLPVLTQLWGNFGTQLENLSSFQLMVLETLDPASQVLQQSWLEFIYSFFGSRENGQLCVFPIIYGCSLNFKDLILKSKESTACNESFAHLFQKQIILLRSIGSLLDFTLSYGKGETFEQSIFEYPGGLRLWSGYYNASIHLEYTPKFNVSDESMLGILKDISASFLDMLLIIEDIPVTSSTHEELYLEHSKKIISEEIASIIKCIYNKNNTFFYVTLLSVWSTLLDVDLIDGDLHFSPETKAILWVVDVANMTSYQLVSRLTDYYRENFILSSHKTKALSTFGSNIPLNINELSVLLLVEAYVSRLIGIEKIVEVWPLFVALHKECLGSVEKRRASYLGLIRWLKVMIAKMNLHSSVQTLTAEEKKVLYDQQALLAKIIESCNTLTAKGLDPHYSVRPSAKKGSSNLMESDTFSAFSGISSSMAMTHTPIFSFRSYGARISEDALFSCIIFSYYTLVLVPQLTDLITDNEKVNAIIQSITYYLITPQLKTRLNTLMSRDSSSPDLQVIFDLLYSISHIGSGLKIWKKELFDFFMDSKFFLVSMQSHQRRYFIQCIIRDDNEKIQELISRVSASVSSNIFTNRELENANRALSIKRLAYVIYCGELNQYLPCLPSIQEKIVEIFKSSISKTSTIPIYLLLRVILVRFSNSYLPNLWPIVFTEVIQSIRQFVKRKEALKKDKDVGGGSMITMTSVLNAATSFGAVGSGIGAMLEEYVDAEGELENIYAVCKFIELMYKVAFEEIQPYQWIFADDQASTIRKDLIPSDAYYKKRLMEGHGLIGMLYVKLFSHHQSHCDHVKQSSKVRNGEANQMTQSLEHELAQKKETQMKPGKMDQSTSTETNEEEHGDVEDDSGGLVESSSDSLGSQKEEDKDKVDRQQGKEIVRDGGEDEYGKEDEDRYKESYGPSQENVLNSNDTDRSSITPKKEKQSSLFTEKESALIDHHKYSGLILKDNKCNLAQLKTFFIYIARMNSSSYIANTHYYHGTDDVGNEEMEDQDIHRAQMNRLSLDLKSLHLSNIGNIERLDSSYDNTNLLEQPHAKSTSVVQTHGIAAIHRGSGQVGSIKDMDVLYQMAIEAAVDKEFSEA